MVMVTAYTGRKQRPSATPSRVQRVSTCAVERQCHQAGEQLHLRLVLLR